MVILPSLGTERGRVRVLCDEVQLCAPSNSASRSAPPSRPRRARHRIGRLLSDEKPVEGFVEFAAPVFAVPEGDAVADSAATLAVRRAGAAKWTARVEFLTVDATATAGADYESARGEPGSAGDDDSHGRGR